MVLCLKKIMKCHSTIQTLKSKVAGDGARNVGIEIDEYGDEIDADKTPHEVC